MRVLGISIWMYFIWIFIVGILLYFYTVNGSRFEAFQNSDSTSFTLPNGNPDQTIRTNGVTGRYIRILPTITQGDGRINLRQVMVMDANGNNFAFGKPVYTTSVNTAFKPGSIVVDGKIEAGNDANTWEPATNSSTITEFLEIDLGSPQYISTIRIIGNATQVTDRMTNLRVQVNATSNSTEAIAAYKLKYMPTTTLYIENTWVLNYNPAGDSGSSSWQPLTGVSSDRLTYQQRLPIGGQLYSSNKNYSLLFGTDHTLYLYNRTYPYFVLWSFYTGSTSSYIFHQGTNGINIVNEGSGNGSSPFNTNSVGSWIGSTSGINNSSYLQVLDNGDLVIYSGDGTMIFHTDTGATAIPVCVPQPSIYDFSKSDCFQLDDSLNKLNETIAELSSKGQTSEVNAAKQMQCNFQQYYNENSCSATVSTTSRAATGSVETLVPPSVNITARLNMAKNIIYTRNATDTAGVDVSASVRPGDMIYLGYGADIQGPFVAQSIVGTSTNSVTGAVTEPNITITKNYMGTNITGAILSIKPMITGNVLTSALEPIKMSLSNTNIIASIYPGESYIAIEAISSSGSSGSAPAPQSPANIDIGELVYVKADNCNGTDTDNGDGTCIGYLCGIGEIDMGNNTCTKYLCNSTNIGEASIPNFVRDTDNQNGTCTTLTTYFNCLGGETYAPPTGDASAPGGTCGNNINRNEVTYNYTRPRSVDKLPYSYNILDGGTPMEPYEKSGANGNIPYIYSKSYGPFVVAMKPSTNKILIKSFSYAKPEVFVVGTGDYTFSQAQGICSGFGAQVATPAQLQDAWTRGADWCACSWTSEGMLLYPINTTILPDGVWGCGGPTPGIRSCGPNNGTNKGYLACYGVKPATREDIKPFRTAYAPQGSQPATMAKTAIWNDPNPPGTPLDLDSSGNFILNPTAAWRVQADLWAKYKMNPTYGIPKYTWSAAQNGILGSQIEGTANSPTIFETFFEAKASCETNSLCTGVMQGAAQTTTAGKVLTYRIRKESGVTAQSAGERYWTKSMGVGGSRKVDANLPTQDNTINMKALPKEGIVNAKLYKASYNDGIFSGSYTSLMPTNNAGNLRFMPNTNSIKIDSNEGSLKSRIAVNGVNLLVGQIYTINIVVKASSPCMIQLERYADTTIYPLNRMTWGNEMPGSIDQGTYSSYGKFKSIDSAKRICEATAFCSGISQEHSTQDYSLRAGTTLYSLGAGVTSLIDPSNTAYSSWLLNKPTASTPNSYNLTTEFVSYTWKFIASNSIPSFLITKTSTSRVTLEFNLLDIIGGIDKSIYIVGPRPSVTTSTAPIDATRVKTAREDIQCLSGYYKSDGLCNKCPIGEYSMAGATACIPCRQGTYAPNRGSTSCIPCAAGKYTEALGSSSCGGTCPAGTFGNRSGSVTVNDCQKCPEGTYNPSAGSNYCINCPKGKYSIITGGAAESSCLSCPSGSTTAQSGANMLALCVQCLPGTAYTNGSCTPCNPGTFSPYAGSSKCSQCPAGTYSENGASSCTACIAGTYSLASSSKCTACDPGYISGAGANICTACGPGTKSSADRKSCQPCTAGTISLGKTAVCTPCDSPSYSPEGAAECCNTGYYYSVKNRKCEECPLDFYNDDAGATSCKPCDGIYKRGTMTTNNIDQGQYYKGYSGITLELVKCTSAKGAVSKSLCAHTNCQQVTDNILYQEGGNYRRRRNVTSYAPHNHDVQLSRVQAINGEYPNGDLENVYRYIQWPVFE